MWRLGISRTAPRARPLRQPRLRWPRPRRLMPHRRQPEPPPPSAPPDVASNPPLFVHVAQQTPGGRLPVQLRAATAPQQLRRCVERTVHDALMGSAGATASGSPPDRGRRLPVDPLLQTRLHRGRGPLSRSTARAVRAASGGGGRLQRGPDAAARLLARRMPGTPEHTGGGRGGGFDRVAKPARRSEQILAAPGARRDAQLSVPHVSPGGQELGDQPGMAGRELIDRPDADGRLAEPGGGCG